MTIWRSINRNGSRHPLMRKPDIEPISKSAAEKELAFYWKDAGNLLTQGKILHTKFAYYCRDRQKLAEFLGTAKQEVA
jgi:hypothetical protein